MFQNANFPGSTPDPAGGAYSAPPDALADSEGSSSLLPSQEPYPRSRPFGPRFYRFVGLTHYRTGNHNEISNVGLCKVRIF